MIDTGTVTVRTHDLHRLLLMFRAEVEREQSSGWQHAVDYDLSFERLADIVEAANGEPDPRMRCKHGEGYTWPSACRARWVNVRPLTWSGGYGGPRLSHLTIVDGGSTESREALCGFTFARDDIRKGTGPDYPACDVCERELRIRDNVTVLAGKGAR